MVTTTEGRFVTVGCGCCLDHGQPSNLYEHFPLEALLREQHPKPKAFDVARKVRDLVRKK